MILIAFGSNLSGPWGNPHETILRAAQELNKSPISLIKLSSLIETTPYGVLDQPNFVNAVAIVETALTAPNLLKHLQELEQMAGRKLSRKWGPRCLDLDIIDFNGEIMGDADQTEKSLILPHPGISQRSFVLAPIAEIAPTWRHPITHETAQVTLSQL